MLDALERLLDHLSSAIDARRQADVERRHRRALAGEPVDRLPLVVACPLPPDARFKPLPYREAFTDPEKMLYNELVHAFDTSIALRDRLSDDLPLTVRANFGTVLIASMFGAKVEQHADNPPWVRHTETGIRPAAVANGGPPEFSCGLLPRVVETMEFYHATLRRRPELDEQVHVVLPDLQGPLDNLGLICGSGLLLDLAAAPREVETALAAMAEAQIAVARRLAPLVRDGPPGYSHQHGVMIRGNVLLRVDSAVMISPQMYREQVAPHDERVLSELGGGVHCCGRLAHIADELLRLPSIACLDLGQSELNDVDAIYAAARARNIAVTRIVPTEEELATGRIHERFPTGVNLVYRAGSFAEATRLAARHAAKPPLPVAP